MIELKELVLPEVEFSIQDGIFIKQMLMKEPNTYVPQHSHKYEHSSMLASGSVRVWRDEILIGDFVAPIPIPIPANCLHMMMSLEPNTVIYCIHRTDRSGGVEITEEHEAVFHKYIEEV